MKVIYPLILTAVIFISCKKVIVPDTIQSVLTLAGDNKKELLRTMEYFQDSGDSLKLQAAYYLIKNLENKYSYTGETYENLKGLVESFSPDTASSPESLKKVKDNIDNELATYSTFEYAKIEDAKYITSDFLINYIEDSFKTFELPWVKNKVNFDRFCRFILPYKVGNEPVENWREEVLNDYRWLVDSLTHTNADIVSVAKIVNGEIARRFEPRGSSKVALSFGYKDLKRMRVGSCYNAVTYTLYVMRVFGLPIEMDYTSQWGNRSGGHEWTVLYPPDTNPVPFDPTYAFQYFYDRFHPTINRSVLPPKYAVVAKIYSNSFELLPIRFPDNSNIPQMFTKNCIDVTNRYTITSDRRIQFDRIPNGATYAYLFVFDVNGWVPIEVAEISQDKSATFKNMGQGVVYLPGFLVNNILATDVYPYVQNANESIKQFRPKKNTMIKIVVRRKYPYLERVESFADRMRDGRFQVSQSPDFTNAKTILTISKKPDPYFQDVNISMKDIYRYFRYLPADSCYGDVAEIEVYANNSKEPLCGTIIGTIGESNACAREKAFDRDKLSYYTTLYPSGSWVGMDFGKPVKIEKIRYLPRNDQNTIEPGDEYELFYWDQSWISLGVQKAEKNYLIFKGPENALYWLRNLSRGKEERIFSFENGKQVWW